MEWEPRVVIGILAEIRNSETRFYDWNFSGNKQRGNPWF